ncbi:hypothetical protein [Frigoribacterium sp. UYMn621]|uniref:hypothetical protein n=1 Tax=Frigoribacterium sp. UYMn621 TaxID=3156343 RepID=UPI003393D6DD
MSYDAWLEGPYQAEESREEIQDAVDTFNKYSDLVTEFDLEADLTFTRGTYTITVYQGQDEDQRAIIEFDESLNTFDEWVTLLGEQDWDDVTAELDRAADEHSEHVARRAFNAMKNYLVASTRYDDEAYEPGSAKRTDYREKATA